MGSSIYGEYAHSVYSARSSIRKLKGRFTVFNGLGEPPADGESGSWDPWLVPVKIEYSARNPAIENHRSLGNDARVEGAELARDVEVQQYNTAVENLRHDLPMLRELESTGESFRSIEGVADELRYIVDEDAKKYYYLEQRNLAGLSEEEFEFANFITHFLGPKRIELTDNQTDAVRIQTNNVVLRSIEIIDGRSDDNIAHRDGVQLIPPTVMDEDKIQADRMAGSLICDISVDSCTIDASSAALQGIFSSDGFCRNLSITNNKIKTAAGHFISIAGVLDGCQISQNTLQQSSENRPQIKLFPGRLGGNIADDGLVYILSFAEDSQYTYGDVENVDNQYIGLNQEVLTEQFSDERHLIPAGHERVALGITNFNYDRFIATYCQWTIADYKASDPIGFRRLRAWLAQRIEEYETGIREEIGQDNFPILPYPTAEQQSHVINTLRPALVLLQEETEGFLETRIADLDSMPIRSFIIKRLAVREGDIVLETLNAEILKCRTAQLKWYLDDELAIDKEVISTANELDDAPEVLSKNYGDLKIMATAAEVSQGQTITFSVNEADYSQLGDRSSYYWMVKGKTANTPEFELDTSDLSEGEHSIRATLYVRPAEGGSVKQVPGSALFLVKAAEVIEPEETVTERPLRAFGDLKEHLWVNHARLASGQKLIVSLDESFIEMHEEIATLRYFWKISNIRAGLESSYEIDTSDFDPGQHLVRVTMYCTNLKTDESVHFSGVAAVEILGVSEPA
jgi:hypothetical protein